MPQSSPGDHSTEPDRVRQRVWPSTHESLLLQLRDGSNASAWRSFVDTYMPLVYSSCTRRGLQHADASDVTQNVFQRLAAALQRFNYDSGRGSFRGWLGTVTRNEIIRYRDRNRSGRVHADKAMSDSLEQTQSAGNEQLWTEEFNDHILRTALGRIRSEFPTDVWNAFEMLWIEGRSVAEVIAAVDRDRGWLYKAKHRVISRLEREVLFLTEDVPQFHL